MSKLIGGRVRQSLIALAVAVGVAGATLVVAPAPAQAAVPASTLFNIAKGQIGTLEGTPAADKYFSQPGLGNQKTATTPWCAAFITWVSWMAGASTMKGAHVNQWVSAARSRQKGLAPGSGPRAGDLVAYKWDSDSEWDHIALVTSVGSGYFWTIEGNVGNPDGVYALKRNNNEGVARYYIKLAA